MGKDLQYLSTRNYQIISESEKAIEIQYVDWSTQRTKTKWIPKSVVVREPSRIFVEEWWAEKNSYLPMP